MTESRWVYITAADMDAARVLGREILRRRLAACVNILPAMESMYWWNDQIESAQETVLIAKTTSDRLGDLIAEVKRIHAYECPCVVALPIDAGHGEFLDWIHEQTHP